MHIDIQQAVTWVLGAIAAGSLGVRLWRTAHNNESHCAGCGECGKPPRPDVRPVPQATPLVSLSVGSAPRRRPQPPTPGA